MTTEKFIKKAKEIHGDKFLYDKTQYVNYDTKLIVTCRKHGDFLVLPRKPSEEISIWMPYVCIGTQCKA